MEEKWDWLEPILKGHSEARRIERLVSAEVEPVVGKGENYASDMTRVKCRVLLSSGQTVTRTVVVKNMPHSEVGAAFLQEYRAFHTEIETYARVLPAMKKLMVEVGLKEETLWCECLAFKEYHQLVFEDLKELGYRNAERRRHLDLPHAKLTLSSLARLHALSVVLLERAEIDPARHTPCPLARNLEGVNLFLASGLNTLATVIRTYWDSEWQEMADKLEALNETVGRDLEELWADKGNEMVVFNHGDCWINNIMFKFSPDGTPVSVKFVDLQESHYNTYGWDLTYFLNTSLTPDMREEHLTELLDTYRVALLNTLQACGRQPNDVPSVDQIKEELRRLKLYALVVSATITPILMCSSEDAIDLQDFISEETEEIKKKKIRLYSTEACTQFIKKYLKSYLSLQ